MDLAHGYVRDSGLAELATGLAWALFGSRSRLTVAKWVNAWTELRTYVLAQFPEAGWRAYIRSWETRIRATRIEMALAHRDGPSDPVMLTHLRGIEEILEHQRLGFHALESWNGEAFRWGAPLARLRVSLPPGAGEIVLDTRELRGPVDRYLRGVSWGTRAVPRRDIRAIRGELHCRLRGPSGPRWLTVVTRPLPPALNGPRDSRRLGIPLFALRSR
ncbi:hypothetical protein [Candidatus Methylomirabilis limnetica]|uniref:hypothetical protein n=1 Tax=Candidatus Methylomirabilis limnetica TaxID=2033718 RepID=UPI00128FD548|nr:hypothetical protein [Candidatus Methylomirabilis limnetica]